MTVLRYDAVIILSHLVCLCGSMFTFLCGLFTGLLSLVYLSVTAIVCLGTCLCYYRHNGAGWLYY